MLTKRLIWSIIIVPVALCGMVDLASGQDVTLRYKHTAGMSLKYTLKVETPSPQASHNVDLDITRDVTSVDGQGVMEINSSITDGNMIINGIPHTFPMQGQVLTAVMTARGVPNGTTATGSLADLISQAGIASTSSISPDIFRSLGILEFPEAVVSEGGTWTVVKNHTFGNGDTLNVTYSYTLDSFVDCTESQSQCAKIMVSAQPTISMYHDIPELRRGIQMNGNITIAGTLLFAHDEGRIARLDETVDTRSVAFSIGYDGAVKVVPVYQKTTITLRLQ